MINSLVSQINVLISIFIANRISAADCKTFMKDLFMYDLDVNRYEIENTDKILVNNIANNYFSADFQFDDNQVNIITNNLIDMVYSSYYYFIISEDRGRSLPERQKAKEQYILKETLAKTTFSYLINEELGIKLKEDYIQLKSDFEKYTQYTGYIVNMYTENPNDKQRIVNAIKKRLSFNNTFINKYEGFGINKFMLMSIVEDDIHEKVRSETYYNKVQDKIAS